MTQLAERSGGEPAPTSSSPESETHTPEETEKPASGAMPDAASRSITLSWEASDSKDVLGYRVYLVTQSTAAQQVVNAGLTTELSLSLRVGETYAFTVTAYNASGESPPPSFVYFSL